MNALIVDAHPFVHDVLGMILRAVYGKVNLQTATNLEGAIAIANSDPKPDLVLLDLALHGCTGIEALAQIRAICPGVPVVVVSANDNRATILAAFRAGVVGYLPKTLTPMVMAAAMQLVAAGGVYVPCEALGGDSLVPSGKRADGAAAVAVNTQLGLTDRQLEVLQLIERGYNNRKIARTLEISEGTVKQHVHALLGALRVTSRTEAIAAANQCRLLHQ